MSDPKLTGKPFPNEERKEIRQAPVGATLPNDPLPNGARSVVVNDTASADAVNVDGDVRRSANHVNPNYKATITAMSEMAHGEYYGDGETRLVANGATYDLVMFQRTGTAPDAGIWLIIATGIDPAAPKAW